ncbi:MAG: LysR family transcriptional regulator [Myxococcota bacterium]
MDWLNYHHLLYFHVVVREGGILPAARALRLSHSTISTQLKSLEEALGAPLFDRQGKRLKLNAFGHVIERYAAQIFSLGDELLRVAQGEVVRQNSIVVGLTGVVPKLVAREVLAPVFELEDPVRLICHEDRFDTLLARLATHELDLVIADAPVPPTSSVRAFNHFLGESSLGFFAVPRLARRLRRNFPQSLDGAPLLLPTFETSIRRALDEWFARQGLHPELVGEVEDSALMKSLGAGGHGVFAAPSVVEASIRKQYGVHLLGTVPEVRDRFYAITLERRLRSAAVVAVCERARQELFAE